MGFLDFGVIEVVGRDFVIKGVIRGLGIGVGYFGVGSLYWKGLKEEVFWFGFSCVRIIGGVVGLDFVFTDLGDF